MFPPELTKGGKKWVYATDGKYLKRHGVLIIHRDVTSKQNLFWSFHSGETYAAYDKDLKELKNLIGDSLPSGAVSDWKRAIVSNVAKHFEDIPHQRCLTHVIRLAKNLLPKKSPFSATLALRKIAQKLNDVENDDHRARWLNLLVKWKKKYGYFLKERTIGVGTKKKWWYTHGNLRRGWRLLTNDWDPFFIHNDYPFIPKCNNSLEGVLSQAKAKLGMHRGMKIKQQVSFLAWLLTFTGRSDKKSLKKLWDEWKRTKKG